MQALNVRALCAGTAYAALLTCAATPVFAQAVAASSDTVEEIIVTGSRIQRKDADGVGVVTTLTEADIKNSGAGSVGELLQSFPRRASASAATAHRAPPMALVRSTCATSAAPRAAATAYWCWSMAIAGSMAWVSAASAISWI